MASIVHRVWLSGTLLLMLFITLNLAFSSFFRSRPLILENSELGPEHQKPGQKVIYILFDALREDYIEWPGGAPPNLSLDSPDAYAGKKVTLFKRLAEEQPYNSFLVPLKSEMPTITVVRIKTFLSGVLGSVQDFMEALVQGEFREDTILIGLHKKFKEKTRTIFFGEDIWVKNFGKWFTFEKSLQDQDVRELDLNDDEAAKNMYEVLDNGSDFHFIIAHLIGMDHAGHAYGAKHPELERKMHDVEGIVETIIEKMDHETTLVVFGDHGMTPEGSHGGSTENEMRTILFSYSKKPFPLSQKYQEMREEFKVLDSMMKQADIAPIGSTLLNIPTPFSNIGITHPIFTQSEDLTQAVQVMRANIEQIYKYMVAYCDKTNSVWCSSELATFESDMVQMDLEEPITDVQLVKKLEGMSVIMNARYKNLMVKWIDHDEWAMIYSILMAINLFFLHQFVSFGQSEFEQDQAGLIGLGVNATIFFGSAYLGLYDIKWAALVCFLIANGQTGHQRRAWLSGAHRIVKDPQTLTPKGLVYPLIGFLFILSWCWFNHAGLLMQEQDYVFDSLIVLTLAFMWGTQPSHLRTKIISNIVVIIICLKVTYINDVEQNRPAEAELNDLRKSWQDTLMHFQFVFVFGMFSLENKIARHYIFGTFFKAQAHSLTAAHLIYQAVVTSNNLALEKSGPPKTPAEETIKNERESLASWIGFTIYIGAFACLVMTIVRTRFIQGKSWDNVSVRCGLIFTKMCMLMGGKCGPMVYFCLVLQIYNFAIIVNKRRDNNPGQTLFIQIVFAYFTMQAYFMRTGHRDKMSTLQVGRVCPGYTGCNVVLHHFLMIVNALMPILLVHLLLPLVVKARVSYVYAHLKKPEAEPQIEMRQLPETQSLKDKRQKVEAEQIGMVSNTPKQQKKEAKYHPESEFVGNMALGMNLFSVLMLLQITMACFYVMHTHEHLIFSDRVAPKFAFDSLRALVTITFTIFWLWVTP